VKDKGGGRKLTISKQSTVKDMKVMLQDELSIPTVYQRLFHRGMELEDNAVTAESLGILANDSLDLREEAEDDGTLTESDTTHVKKKRREEGRGFGGTLLIGSSQPGSRSSTEATEMDVDREPPHPGKVKSCSACTFANCLEAIACDMCDTPLI